jgi:hypothetical protein
LSRTDRTRLEDGDDAESAYHRLNEPPENEKLIVGEVTVTHRLPRDRAFASETPTTMPGIWRPALASAQIDRRRRARRRRRRWRSRRSVPTSPFGLAGSK